MTDLRKVLASNLKLYRKTLGMSQAKFAEMANITDNYVALIETGKRFPSINILERLANALNKDTIELFSIKTIKKSKKEEIKTAILSDIDKILMNRLNESEL